MDKVVSTSSTFGGIVLIMALAPEVFFLVVLTILFVWVYMRLWNGFNVPSRIGMFVAFPVASHILSVFIRNAVNMPELGQLAGMGVVPLASVCAMIGVLVAKLK